MKIITTVGTSLATNIINPLKGKPCDNLNEEEKEALECFNLLKQRDYKQKENMLDEYNKLKNFLLKRVSFNEKSSAEIKSLISIRENLEDIFLEIELIATDTILSPLCSEILKRLIEENISETKANFNNRNIIEDLQVSDYKRYKRGLINLLNRLNQFAENGKYFDNLALNITGGFKGVIPYLTIYGQVNNIPIFYIFEFTSSLIEIPQIPITIDRDIFKEDWEKFYKLEQSDILDKSYLGFDFIQKYENILEVEDGLVSFNALGKILWDRYRRENFIFYTTSRVFKDIERFKNVKNILKSKFQFNYRAKTEQKNGHYVYDDGNNPYRVFYFEEDGNIYIYNVFENHDSYEKYINQLFDREEFKREAKLFRV